MIIPFGNDHHDQIGITHHHHWNPHPVFAKQYPASAHASEPVFYANCWCRRRLQLAGCSRLGISSEGALRIRFLFGGIHFVTISMSISSGGGVSSGDLALVLGALLNKGGRFDSEIQLEVPRLGLKGTVQDVLTRVQADLVRAPLKNPSLDAGGDASRPRHIFQCLCPTCLWTRTEDYQTGWRNCSCFRMSAQA